MAERLALLSAPPGGVVRVSPRLELVPMVDTPFSTPLFGAPILPFFKGRTVVHLFWR